MDHIALTNKLSQLKVALISSGYLESAKELENLRFDIIAGHWAKLAFDSPEERRQPAENDKTLDRLNHLLGQQNPISLWLEPPHLGTMIERKGDEYHMNLFETKSTNLAHKIMDKEEVVKFLEPHKHWNPIQHVT